MRRSPLDMLRRPAPAPWADLSQKWARESFKREAARLSFMKIVRLDVVETGRGPLAIVFEIPCIADRNAPASGTYSIQDGFSAIVIGSPSAWAEIGAVNLASAFRPEGV